MVIYRNERGQFAERPNEAEAWFAKLKAGILARAEAEGLVKPAVVEQALINKMIDEMSLAINHKLDRQEGGYALKRTKSQCAYWASVTAGGYVHHSNNQACHAALNYDQHKGNLYIASRIQHDYNKRPIPPNVMSDFLDWLVNRSPWEKCFVNKLSGAETLKVGYVVVTTDVPANLMAGALIAARMMTEHQGSIPLVWWYLVNRGVNEDVAFPMAHLVHCNDLENVSLDGKSEWHACWAGEDFDRGMVDNFVNRNPVKAHATTYREQQNYTPVCNIWGKPKGGEEYDVGKKLSHIKAAVLGRNKGSGNNPFLKAEALKEIVPIDKFCDLWAPEIIEEFAIYHMKEDAA